MPRVAARQPACTQGRSAGGRGHRARGKVGNTGIRARVPTQESWGRAWDLSLESFYLGAVEEYREEFGE